MPKSKSNFWKIVLVIFLILIVLTLFVRIVRLNNNHNPPSPDGTTGSQFGVSYGSDKLQKFDFYAPAGKEISDTLIVVVHGGAWIGGDKNYMANVADYFSNQGYSVVNINYRLVPNVNVFEQLTDIESVLNYVDARKNEFYLTNNYKIVLFGHSAGAHLSAFYGVDEDKYGAKNINYIIGLAGPYDLDVPSQSPLGNIIRKEVVGDFGVDAVSPIDNIESGDNTKFLLILGQNDELVPLEQLTNFENELKSKNVYVESLVVDGRTHNSIFGQIPNGDIVARTILEFIR